MAQVIVGMNELLDILVKVQRALEELVEIQKQKSL